MCTIGGAALHHLIEDPWASVDWARVRITRSGQKTSLLPNQNDAQGQYEVVAVSTGIVCELDVAFLDVAKIGGGARTAFDISSPTAASDESSRFLLGEEGGDASGRRGQGVTRVQLLLLAICAGFVLGRWSGPAVHSAPLQQPLPVLPRHPHAKQRLRGRVGGPAHIGMSRNASVGSTGHIRNRLLDN